MTLRTSFAATATLALALCLAAPAHAQTTLRSGLGGVDDFGGSCLHYNDDGSSPIINIATAFPSGLNFFGTTHNNIYVNTNGNITFSGTVESYTPQAFPIANVPMIAPFWADVDTRRSTGYNANAARPYTCDAADGANGSHSGAAGTDCPLTEPHASGEPHVNGIWWDVRPGQITVTWNEVNFFQCNANAQNSFQLILSEPVACTEPGDFDVEFRFAKCEWNTGQANTSGGDVNGLPASGSAVPAQSGFDAGDLMNYVALPDSMTADIHTTLCTQSNVGQTGVWRFFIRSGSVICPDAGELCTIDEDAQGQPVHGVCRQGVTACSADVTECRAIFEATEGDDICDGVDSDCDGLVDEDPTNCDLGQFCDRGQCVSTCSEFGCPAGTVCNTATYRCQEESCLGIECPLGEQCIAGECVPPCAGILCPRGQQCLAGRCIDLCEAAECDATCTVCEEGQCLTRCDLSLAGCPSGEACLPNGTCVEVDCAEVDCATGFFCEAGTCVDGCAGVVCPAGEICIGALCAREGDHTGGPGDGTGGGTGGSGGTDGGSGGTGGGSGGGGDDSSSGCGCHVPGETGGAGTGSWLALGIAAFGLSAARRRRRRR